MPTTHPTAHRVPRFASVLMLALVLGPTWRAAAQPVPTSIYSFATLSSRVEPAATIYVRTRSGDVVAGPFSQATDDRLAMTVKGQTRSFAAADVVEVRLRGGNRAGRGALAGMGIGVALAGIMVASSGSSGDSDASVAPAFVIGGAGGGAMWGAIIGACLRDRPVVYQSATPTVRVVPVVTPRQVGVLASVRF